MQTISISVQTNSFLHPSGRMIPLSLSLLCWWSLHDYQDIIFICNIKNQTGAEDIRLFRHLPGAINISVLLDLILKNLRSFIGSKSLTTDFAWGEICLFFLCLSLTTWDVIELTMEVIFVVVALSRVVLVTIPAPVKHSQVRLNLKPVWNDYHWLRSLLWRP